MTENPEPVRLHPAASLKRFIEAQMSGGTLILWAIAVGALAGAVGGSFRYAVTGVAGALDRARTMSIAANMPGWVLPMVSTAVMVAAAAWLVQRFAPETRGSGVQEIEGALDGSRPLRWQRVLPIKFIGGVLSLGAGMLMGREGPTIQMGGALGRMLGDLSGRSEDDGRTLVAAGAGAGLAAAFNAPLAGVLLVIEEMRAEFQYSVVSVQCVLVACAVGDIVVQLLLGSGLEISMVAYPPPQLHTLWAFAALGGLFGLLGLIFNGAILALLDVFDRIPYRWRWAAAGGVGALVGLLGSWRPDVVGGGYHAIADALSGKLVITGLLGLSIVRLLGTVICFASGPPGGIFAPMLALGTLLGLAFGDLAQQVPGLPVPGTFVVAGMGALFSATVRAPVTGVVLVLELTGNYTLLLPVMVACVFATIVAHRLGGQPIYTLLLERSLRRGSHPGA